MTAKRQHVASVAAHDEITGGSLGAFQYPVVRRIGDNDRHRMRRGDMVRVGVDFLFRLPQQFHAPGELVTQHTQRFMDDVVGNIQPKRTLGREIEKAPGVWPLELQTGNVNVRIGGNAGHWLVAAFVALLILLPEFVDDPLYVLFLDAELFSLLFTVGVDSLAALFSQAALHGIPHPFVHGDMNSGRGLFCFRKQRCGNAGV
jgi:hypothetical protein